MTVCIAAIYNNNAILGASDRMITGGYGDITFEPPSPKILDVNHSIALMTAGDQSIQIQVFQEMGKIVGEKIGANPEKWLDVQEVAEIYSKCYYNLRNRLLESQILSKYQLTLDSFVSKQKGMQSKFIDRIADEIESFDNTYMRDRTIETIITGIDNTGPHIYLVVNGEIICNDKLGFAAIGIGASHATSHFMLSKYSRTDSESKSLLTIYQAKKKSEVSPGVGKETDMCVIGPKLGTFKMLIPLQGGRNIVEDLDKLYKKYTQGMKRINDKAENGIKDYLSNLSSQVSPAQEMINNQPTASSKSKKVVKIKEKSNKDVNKKTIPKGN